MRRKTLEQVRECDRILYIKAGVTWECRARQSSGGSSSSSSSSSSWRRRKSRSGSGSRRGV